MTNQRLLDATAEAFPRTRRGTPRPGNGRKKSIDREEVRRRTQQGQTLEQIAHDLGCSIRGIANVRAELGLTSPHLLTPERRATIEAAIADGWSQAEICRTHHVDPETMRRHYPHAKWDHQQRAEHQRTLRQEHQYDWGRQKHSSRRKAA
ncbi:hypothetical protein [Paenarthrobacter sp. JL.01a]|uniref:hypothetical protein n=1 Tax=Paenarthrobacter sp. JL.01a TaxID=2979324 RepID=UPI0021C8F0CD|nr:hypothetical protein [Paenarthrobacter sp. JL.01a]UXM92542.1 hypothetical protein N5P29_04230 [Paenarthrobacter sp. JL.01a]